MSIQLLRSILRKQKISATPSISGAAEPVPSRILGPRGAGKVVVPRASAKVVAPRASAKVVAPRDAASGLPTGKRQ
jgi:hypothetical protein